MNCHHGVVRLRLKGKVHPKNMLVSDVRSEKIGKNAVDCFSNITSGSQDICLQSGGTCDKEGSHFNMQMKVI